MTGVIMKIKTKLSRYAIVTIVVWGACLFLMGIGYSLLYAPQKAELFRLRSQSEQNSAELETTRVAILPETREKMNQQCQRNDRLIDSFSTLKQTENELVFHIGQIASELDLVEFSSKQQKQKGHTTVGDSKTLAEVWLDIEFFATFQQFARFINELERNCPAVFVEEVFFRRKPDTEKGHDVKLQLSFLTRTEKQDKRIALAVE